VKLNSFTCSSPRAIFYADIRFLLHVSMTRLRKSVYKEDASFFCQSARYFAQESILATPQKQQKRRDQTRFFPCTTFLCLFNRRASRWPPRKLEANANISFVAQIRKVEEILHAERLHFLLCSWIRDKRQRVA
jgi:hypothetical protein